MGPFKVRICFDWLRPGPQHCQGLGPIGELGHGRTSTSALPAPASVAILQWRGGGGRKVSWEQSLMWNSVIAADNS